ncbi:MAG: hypothetical protein AAGF77_09455 [Bacteroidota bacterium]
MTGIKNVLATVKRENPLAYGVVIFHAMLVVLSLLGWMIDDRMLDGLNVWVKPMKFSISGGIYVLTVGYLITLYPFSNRKKKLVTNIISWAMALEISIVVIQAARGVRSHFNQSNIVDGILFGSMGLLIGIVVLGMVFFIVETLRLRLKTTVPVQVAIFLGWCIVFYGSWVGGQMISQMSHTVGAPDGGEGLPVLSWSTVAGDLRIAHFFGLHAIQIIPLFAIKAQKWTRLNWIKILVILAFAALYAAWLVFTFYQAKQGLPLINL